MNVFKLMEVMVITNGVPPGLDLDDPMSSSLSLGVLRLLGVGCVLLRWNKYLIDPDNTSVCVCVLVCVCAFCGMSSFFDESYATILEIVISIQGFRDTKTMENFHTVECLSFLFEDRGRVPSGVST